MTKQTISLLLVFSCLLSNISAQNSYSALLHKPYEQRCRLLDSLFYPITENFDRPALAAKLQQVAILARQQGDEELQLEMEYRRLRFISNRQPNPQTEQQLQELVRQAKADNFRQLEIRAMVLQALRQHIVYQNVWASIELYLTIHQRMQQMPLTLFPDKRDYLFYDLANIYYSLEDYESAKAVLLEAASLPFYPVPFSVKIQSLINVDNTLGLVYRAVSKYDSAIAYFEKGYEVALQQKDSAWIGVTSGNIGITYFLQKRYNEAIPLLQNDVQLSLRAHEYSNAANSLMKLAEISLAANDRQAALRTMVPARAALATASERDIYAYLNSYYLLMARLQNIGGNDAAAYRYADSALQIQDTLFRKKRAILLARAQQKTNNEHLKLEVEKLENQQKIQALVRNGLLCLLGLLIIITLLLVSRQQLLKKQKQLADAGRQTARKELADAQSQLRQFTTNIREKNELVEQLTAEMADLQTGLNRESIDQRQSTLEQLRRQTILTDADWDAFRWNFEKVYPEWFDNIQKELPGLSAADLRFLALSKLKLNTREMAGVLGINTGSVRMSRHRIRKKYNLTDEESLDLLIEKV